MKSLLALPALLLSFQAAPALAQASHLGVEPSRLVQVQFRKEPTLTEVWVVHTVTRTDGTLAGFGVPAGKVLVLLDLHMDFTLGPRPAATTFSFQLVRLATGPLSCPGLSRSTIHHAEASPINTRETFTMTFPGGLGFYEKCPPAVLYNGTIGLVLGAGSLSATGYLMDLPL